MSTPRQRFLWWYAWTDLFNRSAGSTTYVNLFTLFVICMLSVATFDVVIGYREIQLWRLKQGPFGLSLWIGQSTMAGRELDSSRLQEVELEVRRRMPPKAPVRIQSFYEVDLTFHCTDPERPPITLRGRTVATDDPIVSRLIPHVDFDDQQAGLIATTRLLNYVQGKPIGVLNGIAKAEPLTQFELRGEPGSKRVPIPILGTFDGELPFLHLFIISEAVYLRMHKQTVEAEARVLHTQPIPSTWPTRQKLPQEVKTFLQNNQIELPRLAEGTGGWEFRSKAPRRRLDWERLFQKFTSQLQPHVDEIMPGFDKFELREYVSSSPLDRGTDFAEVRVEDLFHLKPADAGCKQAGYPTLDNVNQVDEIANSSDRMLIVFTVILAVIAINGCWNILAIQKLRSQQKLPEIGLLKAVGISGSTLRWLFVREGVLLWMGAVLGTIVGATVGLLMGVGFLTKSDHEIAILAGWLPWITAGTLGGSFVATIVSVLAGTHLARRSSPIETLRNV